MKPILFNTEMVKAILDGIKTETRRPLNPQPVGGYTPSGYRLDWKQAEILDSCEADAIKRLALYMPYKVGDILYVRETFSYITLAENEYDEADPCHKRSDEGFPVMMIYRADGHEISAPWSPSIHMAKWAARIFLLVTWSWVERVQDITEAGALAEGIECTDWPYSCEPYRNYNEPRMAPGVNCSTARRSFQTLWDSIYAKRGLGWDANPYVPVIKFERTEVPD